MGLNGFNHTISRCKTLTDDEKIEAKKYRKFMKWGKIILITELILIFVVSIYCFKYF